MNIKKVFSVFLSTIMVFSSASFYSFIKPHNSLSIKVDAADVIESGKCGSNAFWEFKNGVLTISGTGSISDWGSAYGPSAFESVRDNIEKVTIKDGIERIGWCNFESCKKLSSIDIADSVTEIGIGAFAYCSNLKEIKLPSNLQKIEREAFEYCSSLIELIIPNTVRSIENGIARGCNNLKSISIIGENSLYSSVDGVLYDKNVSRLIAYPAAKADSTYTTPSTVKTIDRYAFSGCCKLNTVVLLSSVNKIEYYAFNNSNSTSISDLICLNADKAPDFDIGWSDETINKNITIHGYTGSTIESYANRFNRSFIALDSEKKTTTTTTTTTSKPTTTTTTATSTTSTIISLATTSTTMSSPLTNITTSNYKGFNYRSYENGIEITGFDSTLTGKVTIPKEIEGLPVIRIGEYASLQIDDNTPSSVPNNGVQFSVITNDYVLVQKDKITSVSIPSSVKEIGSAAFAYCKNLKEVEFASGLEKIEHDAFYYTGITNLLLPNSVKYIGAAAFCSCSDLSKVSLSTNLEFLGMHNFIHSKLDNNISDDYFIVDGWFITYISSNGSYPKVLSIPQNTIGIAEQSSIYLYDNAMHDTSKIELPSSITIISNNAFIYYLGLEQFDVSADNPYFCDVNGVLYNKDLTSLIRFPANSTVTDFSFPSTIISTSPLAFYSCEKLKSVKMDNKLSDLGGAAFMGCKNLKSVTFSNNLKRLNASTRIYSAGAKGSIDIRGTFEQCDSLTEIVIPANINYIGNQSFAFCQGLKKVVVENPECEIDDASGEWTFYNGLDDKNNAIDTITLYGYKDSTLQSYAQKYNMRFIEINTTISFGDVNGDNQINAVDASAVLAYYAMISTNKDGNFNESQKVAADVNDDGQINAVDASNILAYYAYLSTTKEDILSLKEYMKKE